ncbi:glycerophosphodiester phosphodiesterase family protein [Olivibacter sp. SDN3]|uniref:glycerophosphodiester phosphodiesterase family protein n=1 Tax=Olivibacter sp. SDN3 TaxID=2764720 RepID=UPI0016515ABE|nr:glycerophosphodiester phosphodiesterase family protein [Olivibacter sp. SDN3]QNL50444.1 glycerophosphodiester phosphodiesterase family protein [Olivibacter sp. SDN3]
MQRSFFLTFLLFISFCSYSIAQQKLYIVPLKKAADLYQFFAYHGRNKPIISGHRGGMEMGFPENSLEAFENTLKYIPAFYEIDPRLTKDSIIVLMHDATLERTTTGKGKVSDYTYQELQQFNLKDVAGNITPFRIPTLADAIEWARGKTILNLDKKDVPMEMTAAIIKEHQAETFVMVTVHNAEQAKFYYHKNKKQMFSAFVKTPEELKMYENAGIPSKQMIAYIGPDIKPENQDMYKLLHGKGIRCMISSASTYDKLETKGERAEAYRAIIKDGADILESDLPIEVGEAIGAVK